MEDHVRARNVSESVDCMQAIFTLASPHLQDDVAILRDLSEFLKKCSSVTAARIESAAKANRLAIAAASHSLVSSAGQVSDQPSDGVPISVENMQMIEPRGRFGAIFSDSSASFENKTACLRAEWGRIEHAICVPNNASAKKDSEDVIVLIFDSPISLNSSAKMMKSVAFVVNRLVSTVGSPVVILEDGKHTGDAHYFYILFCLHVYLLY